jgi:hypothetical protein
MDYSFYDVNQATVPIAPTHAMQFGHAIHRILHRIAYAPSTQGPVLMTKFDLSDGFYRICLAPAASLSLAVLLPGLDDRHPLIGIPLSLPMG